MPMSTLEIADHDREPEHEARETPAAARRGCRAASARGIFVRTTIQQITDVTSMTMVAVPSDEHEAVPDRRARTADSRAPKR